MVFLLQAEICLLVYAGVKPGPSFYGRKKIFYSKIKYEYIH